MRAAQNQYGPNTWQSRLSRAAQVHRQTVRRALIAGEPVLWDNFDKICVALDLTLQAVSDPDADQDGDENNSARANGRHDARSTRRDDSIDRLVETVRGCVHERIRDSCGTIQLLANRLPINRFVELNLHPMLTLPSEQMTLARALGDRNSAVLDQEGFDRIGLSQPVDPPIPCREAIADHPRLLVYGWPGSGKTSYLKWLATQCNQGNLLPDYVPVFLEVRAFAPKARQCSLQDEIQQYLEFCRVEDVERVTRRLMLEGRIFLLLDGLDEVFESQRSLVYGQVEEILNNFYRCRFAFSCRLPLLLPFGGSFDKMLIASFNARQRSRYVHHWFEAARVENPNQVTRQFLERLGKHVTYGELTRTPILLDLLCRVFRQYGRFPQTRADVYDLGLLSLLKEEAHNLRASSVLRDISLEVIRDLLRAIAAEFFLRPQLQTAFNRRELERKVKGYFVKQLKMVETEVSAYRIITDIELTYGLVVQQASNLCSFSHLTFQEYFTAEHLVNTNQQMLVHQHLTNPQWRFVIELVAELLRPEQIQAFFTGFKQAVDALVLDNPKILQFLDWIDQTAELATLSVRVENPHKATLLRAWYFTFTLEDRFVASAAQQTRQFEFPDLDYATSTLRSDLLDIHALFYRAWHTTRLEPMDDSGGQVYSALSDRSEGRYRPADARSDYRQFVRIVDEIYTKVRQDPKQEVQFDGWRDVIRNQQQQHHLPQDWWDHNRKYWRQRVGRYMTKTHGLRCDWEFSEADVALLYTYYNATKLLSICLNLTRRVSGQQYQQLVNGMLRVQLPERAAEPPSLWR
ncbi:MAG: NACHT domain-containing protein [Elainellaceae cyanobacterium]